MPVLRGICALGLTVAPCVYANSVQAAEDAAEKLIRKAQRFITVELKFAKAQRILQRALEHPELSSEQSIEAHRLLGIALTVSGKKEQAEAAFLELLRRAPDYRMDPLTSPKIQKVFDGVRQSARNAIKFSELHVAQKKNRLRFSGSLHDPGLLVSSVALHIKNADAFEETRIVPNPSRELRANIPILNPHQPYIEYYATAKAHDGTPLTSLGSAKQPRRVMLTISPEASSRADTSETESPRWYKQWWVWAIGGAVVATTVAVALSTTGSSSDPNSLEPIRVTLPLYERP